MSSEHMRNDLERFVVLLLLLLLLLLFKTIIAIITITSSNICY
jgi:hypothetical protein